MLWVKSFHILFVITWMSGLLYLPRLYVYHAQADDEISIERFKVMERKLFFGIATPGGVISLITGFWLWLGYGFSGTWLHYKLLAVAVLILYHILCLKYMIDFKKNQNSKSHVFYRWFNELPVLVLAAIILLVVFKPIW